MEYPKQGKRRGIALGQYPNAQSPPKGIYKNLQPMGRNADVKDMVDAIIRLTEADQVTGEVLHVGGSAHVGGW